MTSQNNKNNDVVNNNYETFVPDSSVVFTVSKKDPCHRIKIY